MTQNLTGMRAWLVQRLSAVYMLVFALVMAVAAAVMQAADTAWWALLEHPVVAAATGLFFLALLLHAWVGMRDVVLDYVGGHPAWRLVLLALLGAWLLGLGLWVARIVLVVMAG